MIRQNKRLIGIVMTVAFILLIPFIAMQFTDEVKWTLSDFVGAAVLLLGTGLMCEFVMRKVKKTRYRIAICVVLLVALLLIWLELAVGIFGTAFGGTQIVNYERRRHSIRYNQSLSCLLYSSASKLPMDSCIRPSLSICQSSNPLIFTFLPVPPGPEFVPDKVQ